MIRCNHCGTDNLDGSEYCDECGKKLSNSASAGRSAFTPPPQLSAQAGPPPPPSFTRDSVKPKPATPYTPPPPPVNPQGQPSSIPPQGQQQGQQANPQTAYQSPSSPPVTSVAAHPNQTTAFNGPTGALRSGINVDSGPQQAIDEAVLESGAKHVRAKLIIQRGGKVGKEFPISGNESMIGRWDADGGIFPDIDLDQDDPEAKVSRRHARISFFNNQYLIEDLGSTNGTFINRGPRLLPGNKQPLNHGDEIIVGKTFLKFILN